MKKIQAFILALLILTGCALSPAYVYAEEEESTAEEQTDSESAEDSSENQAGKEETPGGTAAGSRRPGDHRALSCPYGDFHGNGSL